VLSSQKVFQHTFCIHLLKTPHRPWMNTNNFVWRRAWKTVFLISVPVRGWKFAHRWGMSLYQTCHKMAVSLYVCVCVHTHILGVLTQCSQNWLKHAQINVWICKCMQYLYCWYMYFNMNNCCMKFWSTVKWLASEAALFWCCLKLFCTIQVISVLF
jgi:hypothetical protein